MIQVKIDNKTIEVPTQLTISKFQQIQKNPRKYEDVSELLSLYLDITTDELKGLPYEQIKFVESVLTQHMTEYNNEIVLTFQHNGVTYGFENDWGNIKWGQWVDMEVFSQQDKIIDNIHILMALLYRPITIENGKKYKLEPYDNSTVLERAQIFLDLPIVYWYGCSSFFLSISHEYIKIIQNSLELNLWKEKMLKPLRRILPQWLLPKQRQDIILNSLINSREKI